MVKSLKFLRHRRTEAGYFSEFLIAKTPNDLENCEPQKPLQPLEQPQQSTPMAIVTSSSAAGIAAPFVVPAQPTTVSFSLCSALPASVASEVVVVSSSYNSDEAPASEPAALSRPAAPPRQSQDAFRVARRRERNRAAAAKCRQRRQDQMDGLAEVIRQLEAANGDLEAEVAELAASKARLEGAIRSHRAQCDSPISGSSAAAAAAAAAVFVASPTLDDAASSVWLAPPPPTPPATAACRRPTSLALSTASSEETPAVSMEIGSNDELPSLTTPRGGSGLTPLLATPLSAVFKMESV